MFGARPRAFLLSAALVVGAVVGFVFPTRISGAVGWSLAVMGILWGLAVPVRRLLRVELRLGEQMAVGAAVWVFVTGVLLALGLASRVPLLVIAGLGLVLALRELVGGEGIRFAEYSRDELRARVMLGAAFAALLTLNLIAMIATRGNPYDDQVAYTAFVKRLLDCGNLIEPFSFRRLSAYGGQTVLQGLAALRGDLESIDLLDRGIFQIIAVLVVMELCARRRLHLGVITIILCFLLSMWDLDINSAAVWTGFTAFAAAYSFASRDDIPASASLALTCIACGFACTLRQNYLLVAGLFPALLMYFHVRARARESSWRDAWRSERTIVATGIALAAAIVLPYMIAAWRSSGTPLYPLLLGTFNPTSPMRPTGGTWLDELSFFVTVSLYTQPINIWWLLAPLMLMARDVRSRRPWPALLLASALCFVFTIHSFTLSDAFDLWRYGFGYMTTLAVVFAVEAGANLPLGRADAPLKMSSIVTFLMILSVAVHFATARQQPVQRFTNVIANVKAAKELGSSKPSYGVKVYAEMQRTVPEGEAIAFLLDQPYEIDYARNKLFNLDLPGFAAPAPGLPSFTSPEHWRAYFRTQGIRYLWFIDGGTSTWMYRRPGWRWRIFDDDELYRYMGSHIVDAIDSMVALSKTSKVLYHDHGVYVIDLGPEVVAEADRGPPENLRQDAFAREISERELESKAWQLAPRSNVVFVADETGPSHVVPLPGNEDLPSGGLAKILLGSPLGDDPHRWLTDRSHIRLLGHGQHHVHAKIWIKTRRLYTVPEVMTSLDGRELARQQPDADGNVTIDANVTCDGWCDLYFRLSTMSEWWFAAAQLHAIKLVEFEWTDAR